MKELNLKVGAKVMLRSNIATSDGLTNGAVGHVVGFDKKKGQDGVERITTVFVKFEDTKVGQKLREENRSYLRKHGMMDATPIKKISQEYSSGRGKKHQGNKAKCIQFPLTLAWAINAHKCQGMTIKSPHKLVVDLDSCFCAAIAYVMLSRVQNINQLFLLSLDTTKIYADETALEEMTKMQMSALNSEANMSNDQWFKDDENILKITSLNIFHLPNRLLDLQCDPTILKSDIICLQETFSAGHSHPLIPGYVCQMPSTINQGRGRGVAAFIREGIMSNFIEVTPIDKPFAQYLKLAFKSYDVITVYKTQDCTTISDHEQFLRILNELMDEGKPTIINGDFNFDYWKDKDNLVRDTLEAKGFRQLITEPTTIRGNCIDHVYIKDEQVECVYANLYHSYFTEHEAVCVVVKLDK